MGRSEMKTHPATWQEGARAGRPSTGEMAVETFALLRRAVGGKLLADFLVTIPAIAMRLTTFTPVRWLYPVVLAAHATGGY